MITISQRFMTSRHYLKDTLLASDSNYLLGNWINDARKTAPTNSSKNVVDNLEFNARNQITMWGKGNIEDYASKEWAGLVGDYYLTRWKMFTSYVLDVVQSGQLSLPIQQ